MKTMGGKRKPIHITIEHSKLQKPLEPMGNLPPSGLVQSATPDSQSQSSSPSTGNSEQAEPSGQGQGQGQDYTSWRRDGKVLDVNPKDWNEIQKKYIKEPAEGFDSVVVVEFYAPWCGPSRFIRPFIEKQAQLNQDVLFLRLPFDSMPEVATELSVDVVPTFLLYKRGENDPKRIVGARRWELAKTIHELKDKTP